MSVSERHISDAQLELWRAEARALDALAEHGSDRRARVAVMDVSVVLALLDELERREAMSVARLVQYNDDDVGSIPAERLLQWRSDAERWQSEPHADVWIICDRLLATIDELQRRRAATAPVTRET